MRDAAAERHLAEFSSEQTHPLRFVMPRCVTHSHSGYKWWCRHCRHVAEAEFRDVTEALWKSQGAGHRIVR